MVSVKQQISEIVDQLSPQQQAQVLDFARGLKRPKGESGQALLEWVRRNPIDPQSLQEMEAAIEDCERVDLSEWD